MQFWLEAFCPRSADVPTKSPRNQEPSSNSQNTTEAWHEAQ